MRHARHLDQINLLKKCLTDIIDRYYWWLVKSLVENILHAQRVTKDNLYALNRLFCEDGGLTRESRDLVECEHPSHGTSIEP